MRVNNRMDRSNRLGRIRTAELILFIVTFLVSICQSIATSNSSSKSSSNSSSNSYFNPYPLSNYDNQTPWGTHEVSITHKDIDYESIAASKVTMYNAAIGAVARRIMSNQSTTSLRRELGDFDELNTLLSGIVIAIPDINELNAGKILFSFVLIWLTNMKCSDISVGDININHYPQGNAEYVFGLSIQDLAISCDLDWRYAYSIFAGSGSAQVYTTKSDGSVSLLFKSIDFSLHPPNDVDATNCLTAIEIDKLDIQGGIVGSIVDLFSETLKGTIAGQINGVACDELKSLGKELLGGVLDLVDTTLEDFLTDDLPPEEDFLYAENTLSAPTDVNLLDFKSLGKESGDWFQTLLQAMDDFLAGMTPDPNSPTGVDMTINKIFRDSILDDQRTLNIPLSLVVFEGHDMLTETLIELDNIKVFGMDTVTSFSSLASAGKYTLLNNFSWAHLNVELDFTLTMKPSSKDDSVIDVGAGEVVEKMKITAGIADVDVDFHFLLAVDEDKVGGLQLGSITDISNILPCVVDTIYQVEVTGFAVEASQIETPTLAGFISPGIDKVASNIANAVFEMYEPSLIKAIPNIFQKSLKKTVNTLVLDYFASVDTFCPKREFPTNDTFINFGDLLLSEEDAVEVGGSGLSPYGHIFRDVMSFAQAEFLRTNQDDGMSYLNELFISKLTEQQSGIMGSLQFPNEVGTTSKFEIGELNADLELKVSNLTIGNIDTLGEPLSLLQPVKPQILNNTLAIGVGSDPLQGSMVLKFSFNNGNDIQLENIIEIGIDLGGVIDAAAQISIIENALMKFPVEDMLDLNCWMGMIPAPTLDSKGVRVASSDAYLALKDLAVTISTLRLNIKCISCTSPLIEELASLISSPDAVDELSDILNDVVNYITNLLGGTFLQVQIDRFLAEATLKCPHSQNYVENEDFVEKEFEAFEYQKQPSDSIDFMFIVAAVVAACFGVAISIFIVAQLIKRRRMSRWVDTLSEAEVNFIAKKQESNKERNDRLNSSTTSMVLSPSIPLLARIAVPFIILGNIGFFLSGHLSLGASVDVDVKIAGEAFRINEIFRFSMAESIQDMWESGAKELAILILVFSGVWPYTKQLTILSLWFMPPKFVSVSKRESIFLWLDTLGKWSFVDIFVLILSLASFRLSIATPDDVFYLPKDFFKLELLVIPCWGLYSNMIAQFVSQFSSHYIIHLHRRVKSDFENREDQRDEKHQSQNIREASPALYKHCFNGSNMKMGKSLLLRPVTSMILIFLSISFVALLILGCILPSYSLEQFGLAGIASSVPYIEHDIFSTVKLLSDQAKFTGATTDIVGLSVLSAALILTVLIVPCFQLTLLLVRWFVPLSDRARLRIFVAVEALASWQYIEVYLFSIIVASWQLGGVSEFLINDYCDGFDEIFALTQYYGILGVNEAQCFRVSAKLELATWILMSAAVIFVVINHFVSSAAAHQEEDLKHGSDLNNFDSMDREEDLNITLDENDNVNDVNDVNANLRFTKKQLRIEPVRFTDYYRCFLKKKSLQ